MSSTQKSVKFQKFEYKILYTHINPKDTPTQFFFYKKETCQDL